MVDIFSASWAVVRDCIVVEMPHDPPSRTAQHLSFRHPSATLLTPFGELLQPRSQLLCVGPAFDLELAVLRLATIVIKTQKGRTFGFHASPLRVSARESPKLKSLGLFLGQLQVKAFQPLPEQPLEVDRVLPILKASYKVVGIPKEIRLIKLIMII